MGPNVYLTARGITVSYLDGELGRHVVRWEPEGAEPVEPVAASRHPARVSVFRGPRQSWVRGAPCARPVRYPEVWPGIDLEVRASGRHLKYQFVVRPGGDPDRIGWRVNWADGVRVTADGRLAVMTRMGEQFDPAPVSTQGGEGTPASAIETRYVVEEQNGSWLVRFEIGDYDESETLVIDPAMFVFSSYPRRDRLRLDHGRGDRSGGWHLPHGMDGFR